MRRVGGVGPGKERQGQQLQHWGGACGRESRAEGAGPRPTGELGGGAAIWRATPEPAVLQEDSRRELPIWQSAPSIHR